jgi:hypothetical protein
MPNGIDVRVVVVRVALAERSPRWSGHAEFWLR